MSELVSFFRDKIGHPRYGSYEVIISNGDEFWEKTHDFIQWIFPLNESSRFNRESPILDDSSIQQLLALRQTEQKLSLAVDRYKSFLQSHKKWRSGYDHNHMRISRVIKCLRLLLGDQSANAFKYWVASELGDDIDKIHSESRRYWRLS